MRNGVAGFQPERLIQARLALGLTQTALASLIKKSSPSVSKWERGEQSPEAEALEKLAEHLGMPTAWFLKPTEQYGEAICFFRSNSSLTKTAQTISEIRLKWLNELSLGLQEWVDWPSVNVPRIGVQNHLMITDAEIEKIALACRDRWQLGLGPVSDVVLALENAGIICLRDELGYTKMDGCSRWFASDERPYVFLANDKANGIRSRFDAAHELGHLVLHRDVVALDFQKKDRYSEIERQAHLFAGAFLLPAESFSAEVSRPSLDTFLALKPRWKVSVGAMISRSKQLGIIDDEYAIRLWKNYSARGWRRGEPMDEKFEFERIRLLPRAINLLLSEGGFSKDRILSFLMIGPQNCERLCGLDEGFFEKESAQVTELRLKQRGTETTHPQKTGDVVQFPSRPRST